ncbi:Rad51-like protein 1 [Elsinoe fawcettii]|nr:Rad51-like protein 1 [Elsinoe fawcettii]
MQSTPQVLPSSSALPVSSHRLPTVSATQALKDLQANAPAPLTSGLPQLDTLLGNLGQNDLPQLPSRSTGPRRGTITEIWGPSGSGKTTLAMHFATHALRSDQTVLWLGTSHASTPLVPSRLTSIDSTTSSPHEPLHKFQHLPLPTLSHILTLLLYPPASIPLSSAALLVVENIHAPLDAAYPRFNPPRPGATEAQKWAVNRRYAIMGSLMAALKRVAATHGLAVVVTCNAVTRGRGRGVGAGLVPAVGGVEWERGVGGRVVCFRDFARYHHGAGEEGGEKGGQEERGEWKDGWYLGVTKTGGRNLVDDDGEVGVVIPVEIGNGGMREVGRGEKGVPRMLSPKKVKRKFDEVADSDDEVGSEYGWDEGDEIAAEGLIDEDDLVVQGERKVGVE